MKILNVCSVPVTFPGGSERVILELSKKLSKNNEVTILQTNLYEEEKPFEKNSKIEGINIITCKNDKFLGGYGYSKEFKKTLKSIWRNYDIVHVYGHGRFTTNYSLQFLKGKKPLVYSPHGFFHDKKNSKMKKMHDIYFSRILRKSKPFCTALTEIEQKRFLDFGVNEKRIMIFPGGIEPKEYSKKINVNAIREKYLGKKRDKKIMLYVGRVHESKGLQHVITAIKNQKVQLLIAGKDAGYAESLKKLAKEEGVEDKVSFLGMVSDKELEELYLACDFFVLFSSWEGFGLVVIEAMNAGKPVIVSDRGSLPTIVKDGETGLIVKYPDEKELSDKIKELSENPKLIEKMSKSAKEFSKKFSWESLSNEISKVYEKLMNNEK